MNINTGLFPFRLQVPAGSIREPMFGTYKPDVVNYGKLGVYMASRMFHVLDTYGMCSIITPTSHKKMFV